MKHFYYKGVHMKRTSKNPPILISCILLVLFVIGGFYTYSTSFKNNQLPITDTRFALNTVVTITLYDTSDNNILDGAFQLCNKYEEIFSRTSKSSELYQLNHSTKKSISVSKDLASLIQTGLSYSQLSKGAFDITIAPISQLWDFTSETPLVPDDASIKANLPYIGYQHVTLKGNTVIRETIENQLDLGAIAKGYIADKIKEYLQQQGVHSALINLGGNILCIGDKNGHPFNIGIQAPFKERNVTLTNLKLKDKSVVTSGIYERCFTKENKLYHHILNPKTGYPYENDLSSVTIISDKSVDGDALSTTCFALGLKKGMDYINTHPDLEAIFVDTTGTLHYSNNFKQKYE